MVDWKGLLEMAAWKAWWQRIRRTLIWVPALVLMALIVWVIVAPGRRTSWTGFGQQNLWEWLELLIIPVVLAVGAYLFNRAERRSDREIATDRAQEGLLQTYLDRMSELLLKEGLRTSKSDSEAREIARARKLTVSRQLDRARKGLLLQFLYESKLIHQVETEQENSVTAQDTVIISLSGADLRNAHLRGANLVGAKLNGADLSGADLGGADLSNASLRDADLSGADLSGADLRGAYLGGAYMRYANLSGADLRDADLSGANLTDARGLTLEQLARVETLHGAKLHEELREQIEKNYPHLLEEPQDEELMQQAARNP